MKTKTGFVELTYLGATYVAPYVLRGDVVSVTRNGQTKWASLHGASVEAMAQQLLREHVIPRGLQAGTDPGEQSD